MEELRYKSNKIKSLQCVIDYYERCIQELKFEIDGLQHEINELSKSDDIVNQKEERK